MVVKPEKGATREGTIMEHLFKLTFIQQESNKGPVMLKTGLSARFIGPHSYTQGPYKSSGNQNEKQAFILVTFTTVTNATEKNTAGKPGAWQSMSFREEKKEPDSCNCVKINKTRPEGRLRGQRYPQQGQPKRNQSKTAPSERGKGQKGTASK